MQNINSGSSTETLKLQAANNRATGSAFVSENNGSNRASELITLKYIGAKTAAVLQSASIAAADITTKAVSFRMLVDAGVNPGVAAKIRREYSLSWSFSSGDDLTRRSTQVRGLGADEAAWVAASAGDWAKETDANATTPKPTTGQADAPQTPWASTVDRSVDAETDGSGDSFAAEAAWRKRSRPTPLTTLESISQSDADILAEAGIISVRSLATANAERVADVLELDRETVQLWHTEARESHNV